MSQAIEIHLIYASIVWLAAFLLTSLRGSATVKYWIWVVTSLNFMLPLVLIPARSWPATVSWFTPRQEFNGISITAPLIALWAAGAMVMLVRLSIRIRNKGGPATPAVVGLVRTRISLPDNIDCVLTQEELEAVLSHERRHAKRHDNLIRLFYELALCLFWFHPLMWIAGSRLALYRELSCDEAVSDGDGLLSALEKLASPENEPLLHATASSFVADRLAYLIAPHRASRIANALVAAIFAAVLVAAIVAPIALEVARYECALTHGVLR
jgi:BlaR1 peptidase M56